MDKIASMLGLLLTHLTEFKTLVQFYLFHGQKRDITAQQEHPTSGWDRATMRRCWYFLGTTGSLSAVIKQLDGDLARTVKQPMLRSFHEKTVTPGWTFTESGPNEKDRQFLVEYKEMILDICAKMEVGMADYAHKAATAGSVYIETVAEYDLYCHYAAGLVGEGLIRISSASGKEAPWLCQELEFANSFALILQKKNIIRDFREDDELGRFFWPKVIWAKYGFEEMKDLYGKGAVEHATWIQSAMIVDALRHACDALDFLKLLRTWSVFVFCSVPVCMAVVSLLLCFTNPEMFQRNIKIREAAGKLVMRAKNTREVSLIFRDYVRKIYDKAKPQDPNFLRAGVAYTLLKVYGDE
ncbi:hypothetical protein PAXINDRAFT_160473 [Paxillus involutus ATCC 200175]|nr:hypothetical protein PAXINDRAFT_160473 [Paxillus involutus ATCC 200175]